MSSDMAALQVFGNGLMLRGLITCDCVTRYPTEYGSEQAVACANVDTCRFNPVTVITTWLLPTGTQRACLASVLVKGMEG